MIKVVSVNRGERAYLLQGKKNVATGIFKKPVVGSVAISEFGMAGDTIYDSKYHGGPDQAVYAYFQEDYHWWNEQLGENWGAGTFGENLTIIGVENTQMFVGDTLVFPHLELQVTAPRIPCMTLAARMNIAGFVKQFFESERPGVYFRVLRSGSIAEGERGEHHLYPGDRISIRQFLADALKKLSIVEMQRYLALPIDVRSRKRIEAKLFQKQNSQGSGQ